MFNNVQLHDVELAAAQIIIFTMIVRHLTVFIIREFCETGREISDIFDKYKKGE